MVTYAEDLDVAPVELADFMDAGDRAAVFIGRICTQVHPLEQSHFHSSQSFNGGY